MRSNHSRDPQSTGVAKSGGEVGDRREPPVFEVVAELPLRTARGTLAEVALEDDSREAAPDGTGGEGVDCDRWPDDPEVVERSAAGISEWRRWRRPPPHGGT